MAEKAILFEVDKCMKCRGCQVACQRAQGLTTTIGNASTVQVDDPMVVKNQKANDSPPFVRYACWHCKGAPCTYACPLGAVRTVPNSSSTYPNAGGAVYIDRATCNPNDPRCVAKGRPCATKCHRGGYPKVGTSGAVIGAYKCDMCYSRAGGPACVETCPAKALTFGNIATIKGLPAYASAAYKAGDGHMFWASSKPFAAPTTDPYIEDHISPMLERLVKSPVSKALVLPALLFGGIYALYRRRITIASELKQAV